MGCKPSKPKPVYWTSNLYKLMGMEDLTKIDTVDWVRVDWVRKTTTTDFDQEWTYTEGNDDGIRCERQYKK